MAREVTEVIVPSDLDAIPDGTTYKRMSTTEQTKLGTVEDSATADQTGGEIKTAYEAEANAYTDTKDTKLTGVEASATADQTGTEIQTAVLGLADASRVLVGSEPQSGEKKVYGIHLNASGNIELDNEDTAES